jgi:hypothetical protein
MWRNRIRFGLRIVFGVGMAIACFGNRFDVASYAVLMLILMELEDINESRT